MDFGVEAKGRGKGGEEKGGRNRGKRDLREARGFPGECHCDCEGCFGRRAQLWGFEVW